MGKRIFVPCLFAAAPGPARAEAHYVIEPDDYLDRTSLNNILPEFVLA